MWFTNGNNQDSAARSYVKCETCKCLLDKNDAQLIAQIGSLSKLVVYYCNSHRKNYDSVILHYPKNTYFKELEVDENGEPVGYVKKEPQITTGSAGSTWHGIAYAQGIASNKTKNTSTTKDTTKKIK